MLKNILKKAGQNKAYTALLFFVLLAALMARVLNVNRNLGFYYDQGRDALTIWNFLKYGDVFLVGPTTGIAGIFRGPWYYWLITPAYFLGGGNPVFPAVYLSIITVAGIFVLYLVSLELGNPRAGLLACFVSALSYYIVVHSRWLSNPAPMLLISPLLLLFLMKIVKGEKRFWPLVGFLAGMAIQFGSAAEVFYIPIILIVLLWQRHNLPSKKILVISAFLFALSFVPQIIFDALKHGVLSKAVVEFLFNKGSFKLSIWEIVSIRLNQYYVLFTSIIFPGDRSLLLPFILGGVWIVLANFRAFFADKAFLVLILFVSLPLLGMFFFQGNYGNVFDYYYSGYYLPMILLFALPLGFIAENWGGKLAILAFVVIFLRADFTVLKSYIVHGRTSFTYSHQLRAIEWIYDDAGKQAFNADIYVPPVIPYAYDYLFVWYGRDYGGYIPSENKEKLLYTLYEIDPPAPERLDSWLNRQNMYSQVEKQYSFGGITVQRRVRHEEDKDEQNN